MFLCIIHVLEKNCSDYCVFAFDLQNDENDEKKCFFSSFFVWP